MPELPEVETIARFLNATAGGCRLSQLDFFRKDLREAIPTTLLRETLQGQKLRQVFRRSKYLLLESKRGYGIIHLGMTGNLLFFASPKPQRPHTHLVFSFDGKDGQPLYLHYVDPRRFGRIGAHRGAAWQSHPFMKDLGPEPLAEGDLGRHLWQQSRKRRVPIKNFVMDAKVMVGVGNIYACEALFRAGIHPERPCQDISLASFRRLARHIRATLEEAIAAGGTTFRDFKDTSGKPGYFAVSLQVYGRKDQPCPSCGKAIALLRQAGRSTWFCQVCQS